MKRLGLLLAVLAFAAGCSHTDPMSGRAGSDLPPGPLQPLPDHSAAQAAPCTTLDVALGDSEHAAGTEYVRLRFTNTGAVPCFVRGYPSLTLQDSAHRQVGDTARPYSNGGAKDLVLAPKETVTADIRFPNPDNFTPGACKTGAVRLEVLIPGATERAFVADSHAACPGWGVSALHRAR